MTLLRPLPDTAALAATPTWFAAQLRPNGAQIAKINLERQGFRTFLPRVERDRRTGTKFQSVLQPLFPGYIFLTFPDAPGAWRSISNTRGVTRLVCVASNQPSALPAGLVEALMAQCDANGLVTPPDLPQPGETVRLTRGPFAEFLGEVLSVDADRRVWMLIELLGQSTRICTDLANLTRA